MFVKQTDVIVKLLYPTIIVMFVEQTDVIVY